MTNAEKFKEVFGFAPNEKGCIAPDAVCQVNAQDCTKCPFNNFFGRDYKGCFQIKEEFDK